MLTNEEKYIFTSELALAISNGLQIDEGLKMLAGFDAGVSRCAKTIVDFMQDGTPFLDALTKSKEFDDYMIQMIIVGQNIGNLDVVLKELSVYYERQKKLHYQTEMTKFTYILSLFVSSGYSLVDAVEIILQSIDHPVLKDKIEKVKKRMFEGESLARALVNENVYDQGYGALLLAADESEHQDEVLKTLSIHYKDDLERMLSGFLNRLEPTMIAGLSLLVGFVLISIMLPLMNVLQTLG